MHPRNAFARMAGLRVRLRPSEAIETRQAAGPRLFEGLLGATWGHAVLDEWVTAPHDAAAA